MHKYINNRINDIIKIIANISNYNIKIYNNIWLWIITLYP